MFELLAGKGLSMLTEMVLDKGEDVVKDLVKTNLGIDLDSPEQVDAGMESLKDLDMQLLLDKEYHRNEEKVMDLALHDVQDAREQGTTMMQSEDKFIKYFLPIFSVLLAIAIIASFVFSSLDDGVREVFKTILIMIIGYWFGSSLGSKQKTDALVGK